MVDSDTDRVFMTQALAEARIAYEEGNIPVGCVIVRDGEIIARAHNLRETTHDPTAHAEISALRIAGKALGSRGLDKVTVYVTLEPCPMCMSAIMLARAGRLVYGAADPKLGAVVSRWNFVNDPGLHHSIRVTSGIMEEECCEILERFFAERRDRGKQRDE